MCFSGRVWRVSSWVARGLETVQVSRDFFEEDRRRLLLLSVALLRRLSTGGVSSTISVRSSTITVVTGVGTATAELPGWG